LLGEGDFDVVRVQKAERRFLESLKAEAKRPVETRRRVRAVQVAPKPWDAARERGGGLGSAYAALNSNGARDIDRIAAKVAAIKKGVNEAQYRDARDAELANDPDYLRSLGFHGRDEDD
jgi:hypothetical protein